VKQEEKNCLVDKKMAQNGDEFLKIQRFVLVSTLGVAGKGWNFRQKEGK
jgi:hypothetical protein